MAAVFLFVFHQSVFADTFTFNTLPLSGNVSGPPGSTVGWGYTITNESLTDWLVTTNLSVDSFQNGIPNSIFDFPILQPGTTLTLPFNAMQGLGLYEFTWDPTAPVGFINNGNFILSAEWWSGDPLAGGMFLAPAADANSAYTAAVAAAGVAEPSVLLLMAVGLVALSLKTISSRPIYR